MGSVISTKRAEHVALALPHLLDALAQIGTVQQRRVAEPAPRLI